MSSCSSLRSQTDSQTQTQGLSGPANQAEIPYSAQVEAKGGVKVESLSLEPPSLRSELSATQVAAGTLLRVSIQLPKALRSTEAQIQGEFEGIVFPFFPQGERAERTYGAVLGIPYERKPGPGKILVRCAQDLLTSLDFEVVDGHYPSEVLHVDGRRVNPTRPSDLIRIQREQAEVKSIYQQITLEKFWKQPFVLPIQSRVTSQFGTRRLYNGQLKNFHTGLDLKAPMRTPIYAPAPGRVVLAKSLFYTGNTVMLDHGYGLITLYAHMSVLKVKLGQMIDAHGLLGLSGKTGRVTGPHLHWQAVVHQVKVNPIGLVEVLR